MFGVGGPRGRFKQGDWACVICGNMNWAKRLECNRCGEAKPGSAPDEKREVRL